MKTWLIGVLLSSGALAQVPATKNVVRAEEGAAYRILDGKGTATLLHHAGTGSAEASVTLLELSPGAAVAEHTHEAAEYLYVVAGAAELTVAGKPLAVKAGDAVFLPKGVKHTAKVPADAKGPLSAVQVYSPAGPEQRFAKGTPLKK